MIVRFVSFISLLFFSASCSQPQEKKTIVKSVSSCLSAVNDSLSVIRLKRSLSDSSDMQKLSDLAKTFARLGQLDSAFRYFSVAVVYDSSALFFSDPDFYNLIEDKRWNFYENIQIEKVKKSLKKRYRNDSIVKLLWRMQIKDQAFYSQIDSFEKNCGKNFAAIDSLWNIKKKINDRNVIDLEKIINVFGWPKISEFGHVASKSAFLVIQHSDSALQKKYLPFIESMCKIGEADWQDYALMYDRIQVAEHKPQLFGSQLSYNSKTGKTVLSPIDDLKLVNIRRKKIGMTSLEEYLKEFGFEPEIPIWKPE